MIMKRKKRKYTPLELETARKNGSKGDKKRREKMGEDYIKSQSRAGAKGAAKRWNKQLIETYD